MAKLMELVLQGNTPTGMFINKYNLYNTSLGSGVGAALNVIESLGYQSGTPGTPAAGSVLQAYLALTFSGFEFSQFYCRDIYDVNDFVQVNVTGNGWQGTRTVGTMEYAAYASKIKSTRTRQDIKAGFKALPPFGESDLVSSVGTLTVGYIALVQTLCTRLADKTAPFVGPIQHDFFWTIASKEEYTTPSGKKAYRYYETLPEQQAHLAFPVTWSPVERATTQGTRKFGRGR